MTTSDSSTTPIDYTNEEWRDIPGWEGLYQISDYGRCKRVAPRGNGRALPNKVKKPHHTGWKSKYLAYSLYNNNEGGMMYAHRAVLLAFVGDPPNDTYQCNHRDGDKHNNHLDNLEWVTPKENQQHRYNELGQSQTGMSNPANKYHESQIQQVLDLYVTGQYTQRKIAQIVGIDYRYVNNIVHGRAWVHMQANPSNQ